MPKYKMPVEDELRVLIRVRDIIRSKTDATVDVAMDELIDQISLLLANAWEDGYDDGRADDKNWMRVSENPFRVI